MLCHEIEFSIGFHAGNNTHAWSAASALKSSSLQSSKQVFEGYKYEGFNKHWKDQKLWAEQLSSLESRGGNLKGTRKRGKTRRTQITSRISTSHPKPSDPAGKKYWDMSQAVLTWQVGLLTGQVPVLIHKRYVAVFPRWIPWQRQLLSEKRKAEANRKHQICKQVFELNTNSNKTAVYPTNGAHAKTKLKTVKTGLYSIDWTPCKPPILKEKLFPRSTASMSK